MEDEERNARAVSMRTQGAWTKWESAIRKSVSWNELWKMEPLRIKFLLRSTYDLLPTPTNLVRWGLTQDEKCPLCSQPCHLEHVLSSCKVALSQHRYTWRHNSVLKVLAHHLDLHRLRMNKEKVVEQKSIRFVKAGSDSNVNTKVTTSCILNKAQDWEMHVDIGRKLQIPQEIVNTTLRPDLLLVSKRVKCLLMLELTVPWESRIDEAHERKRLKYDEKLVKRQRRLRTGYGLKSQIKYGSIIS